MLKKILCIIAIMAASSAHAYVENPVASSGWDKLTAAQKADIQKQVALAAESAASPTLDVKKVDEYVVLGERIGKMMGGAAKEVGVAVNTFVETPVGKWTMAMIIWKFMGNAIIHVAGAAMILVFGFTFLMILLRRRYPLDVEYKPDLFLGVFSRKLSVKRKQLEDGDTWFFSICGAVVTGAAMIVLFTGN